VITVTYTPTFDLLRELLAEDERRAAAKTLNALCQWLAWQLPIGTVKQISIYADDKLVELAPRRSTTIPRSRTPSGGSPWPVRTASGPTGRATATEQPAS